MIVAAQLYIFNNVPNLADAMPALLDGLATAGYAAVEGMYGKPPQTKARLEASGLGYLAPHIVTAQLEPPDAVSDFAIEMGAESVCCSGLREWNRRAAPDYYATIEILNRRGRELRERGIQLLYHNHDFEFLPVDGERTGMDLLLTELEAANVALCFDAGWAWRVGHDPALFLRTHRERIGIVHLRDFRGTASVPLGQGEADLNAILQVVPELPNLRALVVEQDPTTLEPLAAMQESRTYLRERFGL